MGGPLGSAARIGGDESEEGRSVGRAVSAGFYAWPNVCDKYQRFSSR